MAANPATTPGRWQICFDRTAKLKAVVLGAAFVAVFWELLDFIPPKLGLLVHTWVYQTDWSHGPLIPLFSAYLVYQKWDAIRRCKIRFTWIGLILLLLGLALFLWSLSGRLPFGYAQPFAMMIALAGVIVFLCGLPIMRYAWLPWLYLFFAIPIPQRIYFALTDPLRRMAATVASVVLSLWPGLDAVRVGSNLQFTYNGQTSYIGVADACSGMRGTVVLCAIGVAVTFMSDRPWWQRVVLLLLCVPIATFCNFIRVTTTCWLYVFVDPKYAHGTPHTILGLAVMGFAFAIFLAVGWVLDRLVVEETEPDEDEVTEVS